MTVARTNCCGIFIHYFTGFCWTNRIKILVNELGYEFNYQLISIEHHDGLRKFFQLFKKNTVKIIKYKSFRAWIEGVCEINRIETKRNGCRKPITHFVFVDMQTFFQSLAVVCFWGFIRVKLDTQRSPNKFDEFIGGRKTHVKCTLRTVPIQQLRQRRHQDTSFRNVFNNWVFYIHQLMLCNFISQYHPSPVTKDIKCVFIRSIFRIQKT